MGGKIQVYLDIASLYSYVAFTYLQQRRGELAAQGVEVEFIPTPLAIIMSITANNPPWILPPKGNYLRYDSLRSMKAVGLPTEEIAQYLPPAGNFVQRAKTMGGLRCALVVRDLERAEAEDATSSSSSTAQASATSSQVSVTATTTTKEPKFEKLLESMFQSFWHQGQDITTQLTLNALLTPLYPPPVVESILAKASSEEYKSKLKEIVAEAVGRGAFGEPWLWVTKDSEGEDGSVGGEAFFGSDRFSHIWRYLGLKFEDVKILDVESKL